MLKKSITYTNVNTDEEVTEDFYFNLSKRELIKLELSEKEGYAEKLKRIAASNDGQVIIDTFEELILMCYGERTADGRGFNKSPEVREAFKQSEPFSELLAELATEAKAAAEFVNAVVPRGLAEEVAKMTDAEKKAVQDSLEQVGAPPELTAVAPKLEGEPEPAENKEPTDEELLAMDPQKMSQSQLIRAFKLKSQTGETKVLND